MSRMARLIATPSLSHGVYPSLTEGTVDGTGVSVIASMLRSSVMLLLLLLTSSLLSGGTEATASVKVLSAAWNSYMPPEYVTAINAGFSASLESHNWTVAGSMNVEVVYPKVYETLPEDFIREQLEKDTDQNNIIIVYGPLGDKSVIHSIQYLINHSVVGLGVMSGSGEVRRWNPYLYFLRADPAAETLALIRYALSQLRVLRLGFMYLQGVHYGDQEYALAVTVMSQMGYELHGVFTVMSPDGEPAPDGEFREAFEQFAAERPQAVIVFGAPEKDTAKFLMMLVAEERTVHSYILGPSSVQVSLAEMWRLALEAAGVTFAPGQLLFTGTNPLAKDGKYIAIQRFQGVMSEYLRGHADDTNITDPQYFLTHDPEGELMVYGWIAGEVMAQALSSLEWLKNRATFVKSLYNQRRYIINDIVVGDYGGICEGEAAKHGATCECNQGGKAVYVKEVMEDGQSNILERGFTVLKASQCYADTSELRGPLNGLTTFMEDSETALKAALLWYTGASYLVGKGELGHSDRLFLHAFNTTVSQAASGLQHEQSERIVTAVFGPVTEAMLGTPNMTFIDPLTVEPRLNKFRRPVIYLSPTLEQQLYVLSSFLADDGAGFVDAVICGEEADGITEVLTRSLTEFGVALRSAATRKCGEAIGDYLPKSGVVFVIGFSASDVMVIARNLEERMGLRVLVLFTEFSLLYDELSAAFNDATAASRLVFATSLPHWGEANTSSKTVQGFHSVAKDPQLWTPLALRAFATGKLMRAILLRVEEMTPSSLENFFYADSSIISDDMRYGVFDDTNCDSLDDTPEGNCASNYGATQISVWSMARALDAAIPPLADPMTPSMKFRDPNEGKLTGAPLGGVIVGAVFALLLVVALGAVPYFVLRNTRDNDCAPKEPTEPVTLVFTDIESSTAQWAAHPDMMADAVAAHHRLIRTLIAKYDCYEVKTVGDSFMIASRSTLAAVQLVRDLQRTFLRHDWDTTAFDEYYRSLEQDRAAENEDYVPPTAHLDPDVYRKLWNGLRVRAGVHTGLCDIRHDEVTKGYDYYGQTSNMAARTESVANGGQVLLTSATYFSLSTAEREQLDATTIGAVSLRGVPHPVEMHQVNAVPGRVFAALRLDREVDLLVDAGAANASSSECGSVCEMGQSAQMIVTVMRALLGTFTASQRGNLLLPFCERWRVALPPRTRSTWDDNYCQEVVRRIAAKVGHVVDFAAYNVPEIPGSASSSSSVIFISDAALELCAVEREITAVLKDEE